MVRSRLELFLKSVAENPLDWMPSLSPHRTRTLKKHANWPVCFWLRSAKQNSGQFQNPGKIQDGRKFLDRFKSYFGSQISSQSLNEVYIYQLQPKSATNGELYSYIFVFGSSWHHGLQMANEADEVLQVSSLVKQAMAIKNHRKCTEKIAIWERWVVSTTVLPKSALRKRWRCSWETTSKGNMHQLKPTIKEKNIWKKLTFCCGFWL